MFPLVIWILIVGTAVILLSFILSLRVRKLKGLDKELRYFFLLPMVGLLLSLNSFIFLFFKTNYEVTGLFIEKVLTALDFTFWFFFFFLMSHRQSTRSGLRIIFLYFLTLSVFIYINQQERWTFVGMGIANFVVCLNCLNYFYLLFKSPPTLVLKKEPAFWITVGLFFYTATTIPIYLTTTYLHLNMSKIKLGLFLLTNLAIIVMHFFFIKAQLCIVKRQKISFY